MSKPFKNGQLLLSNLVCEIMEEIKKETESLPKKTLKEKEVSEFTPAPPPLLEDLEAEELKPVSTTIIKRKKGADDTNYYTK